MTLAFELVLLRFLGLFAVLPLFPRGLLSLRLRLASAFVLSASAFASAPVREAALTVTPEGTMSASLALGEIAVGLALGSFVVLSLASVRGACRFLGQQIGLDPSALVGPGASHRANPLESLYSVLAMVVFVSLGLHLTVTRSVVESFVTTPPGSLDVSMVPRALGQLAMAAGGDVLAAALTLALPVTLVLLLVSSLHGVLSRMVPGREVFLIGLPLRTFVGLVCIAVLVPTSVTFLSDLFRDALSDGRWLLQSLVARS